MRFLKRRRGATTTGPQVSVIRARNSHRTRLFAALAVLAVATTGSIVGQAVEPAYAADYPSWEDVQSARGNEAAKQAEITKITELLAQLDAQVAETKAAEIARGTEYQVAQQEFDEADFKARQLQTEADEAQLTADESKLRAGQLAARLSRSGGDVPASLFFDGDSADDLLAQLGMASKITDQSAGIYEKATQDQNSAQSLTDQANVAKDALQELADAAAAALEAATIAAEAADAALVEQQKNEVNLQAQLAVLVENRAATEADYQAGVRAREAEAARIAEERRQASAAAAAASQSSGGGSAPGGQVAGSNWARPSSGRVNSTYGYRIHPIGGDYRFHNGTDISAGCGWPIYAASAGTVTYSGWNGGYGNYISVAHGGGVSTSYAHIVNGGLLVGRGQSVGAGQVIAYVGTTGGSTGCHLHYEVRVNGSSTDPVPFMRARGVSF